MRNVVSMMAAILLIALGSGATGDDKPLLHAWTMGGPKQSEFYSLEFMDNGSIVAAGTFTGSIRWGDTEWDALGELDSVVARFSQRGDLAWVYTFGSRTDRRVISRSIATDHRDRIYVGGSFEGITVFSEEHEIVSRGGADGFLIRLSPNGDMERVFRFGGTGADHITGVAVGPDDAVYLTGHFTGEINADPGPDSYTIESNGGSDGFVIRLDAEGAFQWAVPLQGEDSVHCRAIAVAPNGTVYVAGQFQGGMTAGGSTAGPADHSDAFVAALAADGTVRWLQAFPSPGNATIASVASTWSNHVVAAGSFDQTLEIGHETTESAGLSDVFSVELYPSGEVVQARILSGAGHNEGLAVETDGQDNVYVSGTFMLPIQADPSGEPLEPIDQTDAFLGRFDHDGTFRWAGHLGGALQQEAQTIAAHHDGTVVWGGYMRGAAEIATEHDQLTLTAEGGRDALIIVIPGPPSVTMTSATPAETPHSRIPVTVAFSHPVTDFSASDIVTTNADVEAFTGSGTTYHFDLVAREAGVVRAEIPAGIARDRRGERNFAAAPFVRTYYDVDPPDIALRGANPLDVEAGTEFVDPGAAAYSAYDGSLTESIMVESPVDTNVLGTYVVRYTVIDSLGQTTEATRTVIVADTVPPELVLNGSRRVSVQVGSAFADPGAVALDSFEGDLSDFIRIEGDVDTASIGAYLLQYRVSDSSGNQAEAFRVVRVVSDDPPVITLRGDEYMALERDMPYADPGATAWSASDGDLTNRIQITNPVNPAIPGIYTVTYNVMDLAGTPATERTRTIEVLAPDGLPTAHPIMLMATVVGLILVVVSWGAKRNLLE